MGAWLRSALAAVLLLVILTGQEPGHAQAPVQRTPVDRHDARDYGRAELEKMLKEVPNPVFCATGVPWFGFVYRAPHTPATVSILQEIFRTTDNPRWRDLVLGALSEEREPSLRAFWLQRLNDAGRPERWNPSIARGLGRVGTDTDLLALAERLDLYGASLLQVIGERRVSAAQPKVLALYRDHKAAPLAREYAFRALLQIAPAQRDPFLKEGLADPLPAIRAEALRALSESGSRASSARALLKDPDAAVRRAAVDSLEKEATIADLSLLAGMLTDTETVRQAAEALLIRPFPPSPTTSRSPFSGYPGAQPSEGYRHFERLLEMAGDPKNPVNHSSRVLSELAVWQESQGRWEAAEQLYRGAVAAARGPFRSTDPNQNVGATAAFNLVRLLYLRGKRREATALIPDVRSGFPGHGYVYARDLPLIGLTMSRTPADAADALQKELIDAPLYLRASSVTTAAMAAELRVKITLTNVSTASQKVALRRTAEGEWLPEGTLSVVLNQRAGLSVSTPSPGGLTQVRELAPGERLEATVLARGASLPEEEARVDVFFGPQVSDSQGTSWRGWLRAVTTTARL